MRRYLAYLLTLTLFFTNVAYGDEPKGGPAQFKRLKFRCIGPSLGGRVSRAFGVPGDPRTYYAASSGGGVWKSTDGGTTWKPIFDDQPISTIGSMALAPSDPNVLYVGSGEANIRGNLQPGNGIYKSTDAGKTWKHVWKQRGQIGQMIVHPTNPDIAFAAVLGHAFGPNKERGIYRTTDGGASWQGVLQKDEDTGASDICFDPNNPRILFAGLWQARRLPWDIISGGPGSGLYTSRDGGDTWTQLLAPSKDANADNPPKGVKYCKGLPEGIYGKIAVGVAPSDSQRVYALIEAKKGGLFRSDDGGETWKRINDHQALLQRAWYFTTLTIHPTNANIVYVPQVPLLRSIDGGKTFERVDGPHHGDHHDFWIDPKDPQRMIDSNDGGVDISVNAGKTWYAPPLPICQFYHIAVNNRTPYDVMGTIQDIGTASGPSNSLSSSGIRLSDWHSVGGGEAGYAVPDPRNPDLVYAGEYGGYISRYENWVRQGKPISIYPYNPSGRGGEELKYRFQWTAPIVVSHHEEAIYHASNVLFKSTDRGQTWKQISDDLTRDDKTKQKFAGRPLTGDNTGVEIYSTIFALAESPKQKGLLWAGSDDGLLHVTPDGGKSWTNVTANVRGMPRDGAVVCIEASPHDAETAYVVVERHRLDDMRPYLFATTDLGKTWTALHNELDEGVYLRVVLEDPMLPGMLYLGTERGVLYSRDTGKTWTPLKLNLPTVPVCDMHVQDDDLVVGTNGRSIWILDDVTPLRQWSQDIAEKPLHLFPPVPTVRRRTHSARDDGFLRWTGDNPPEGVILHYTLADKVEGELVLEILDEHGQPIKKLTSKKEKPFNEPDLGGYSPPREPPEPLPTEPGLHRVVWDLSAEKATPITNARVDLGRVDVGPMVLPGTYTAKLTANGQSVTTKVEVQLDPRLLQGTESDDAKKQILADMRAQYTFALQLRDNLTKLSRLVETVRSIRKQLETTSELVEDKPNGKAYVASAKKLIAQLNKFEERLHNPKAKGAYDILAQRGGAQLYSQLAWLYSQVLSSDNAPTQGMQNVYQAELKKFDLIYLEWMLREIELDQFNAHMAKISMPRLVLP